MGNNVAALCPVEGDGRRRGEKGVGLETKYIISTPDTKADGAEPPQQHPSLLGTGRFSRVYRCWARPKKPPSPTDLVVGALFGSSEDAQTAADQHLAQKDSDAARGRPYAMKVTSTRTDDTLEVERIYHELRILKALREYSKVYLKHGGAAGQNATTGNPMPTTAPSRVVQLVDCEELPHEIRLVLELCEGGELYDRIQQVRFFPEQDARQIMCNILEGVAFLHAHGIMHRDLKPENILLVSPDPRCLEIKISDFGLAKMTFDFEGTQRLPRATSICGSDFYLAPEVIKQLEYGREIDIWSCGIVCYVLLSGSLPFFHRVLHKLYRQIVDRDLHFPCEEVADGGEAHTASLERDFLKMGGWTNVSKGAQDLILRLLQVEPGERLSAESALQHPWLQWSPAAADAGQPGLSFAGTSSFASGMSGGFAGLPPFGEQPSALPAADDHGFGGLQLQPGLGPATDPAHGLQFGQLGAPDAPDSFRVGM